MLADNNVKEFDKKAIFYIGGGGEYILDRTQSVLIISCSHTLTLVDRTDKTNKIISKKLTKHGKQ